MSLALAKPTFQSFKATGFQEYLLLHRQLVDAAQQMDGSEFDDNPQPDIVSFSEDSAYFGATVTLNPQGNRVSVDTGIRTTRDLSASTCTSVEGTQAKREIHTSHILTNNWPKNDYHVTDQGRYIETRERARGRVLTVSDKVEKSSSSTQTLWGELKLDDEFAMKLNRQREQHFHTQDGGLLTDSEALQVEEEAGAQSKHPRVRQLLGETQHPGFFEEFYA